MSIVPVSNFVFKIYMICRSVFVKFFMKLLKIVSTRGFLTILKWISVVSLVGCSVALCVLIFFYRGDEGIFAKPSATRIKVDNRKLRTTILYMSFLELFLILIINVLLTI